MTKELAKVMAKELAAIDPKLAVFMYGSLAIVALGGMVLGYDVDLSVLGNGVRLTRPREQ